MDPFVSADWLQDHLADVVVADVRWYLDGRSGLAAYAAGHLPGAVFVDLDAVLAAPASRAEGRHPLPDPEVFAQAMGGLGIGDDSIVVAYDDARGASAARLVWMLRALGHAAAVLDGGLDTWPQALVVATPIMETRRFTPRPWPESRLADADAVAVAAKDAAAVVIDARAPERYRGEREPIDDRAGHVPGAVSVPVADNFGTDGRLLQARFLEDRYRQAGADADREVIAYCGSGVTACVDLLALEHVGFERTRLYPGSWSQWAADRSRPAKPGDLP